MPWFKARQAFNRELTKAPSGNWGHIQLTFSSGVGPREGLLRFNRYSAFNQNGHFIVDDLYESTLDRKVREVAFIIL